MFKMKRYTTAVAALSIGGMIILAGCSASDAPGSASADTDCVPAHSDLNLVSDGVLTVGIPDLPPLVFPGGPDGIEGIDSEIILGFAEVECLTVDPVTVSPAAAIASVEQGRVDTALGGWYRSAARNEIVTMSDPMYLDAIIAASEKSYKTFDEMLGLNIGITQGYIFQSDLEAIYGSNLNVYPELTLMAEDLANGRIDVAFDVASSTSMYEDWVVSSLEPDNRVPLSVEPTQTGLPFQKGDDRLLNAFNAYLTDLHAANGVSAILEEWSIDPGFADVGEPRLL